MSSLTQQVSDLHVNTLITLDVPTHVESELLLHYAQNYHVDSSLGVTLAIALCRFRSLFPYFLYDMSSLAGSKYFNHDIFYAPVQT